ncbi:MAG TPA: 1-deoxy-D-xylulose-5-phosphate reductoisomerase [Candidatus Hydrogenedentes bacterium]|nr:1-deoxy-D-xylulose-5-phosphate reductoisomerase [Candidatus Hydrogenedentota bacterium]
MSRSVTILGSTGSIGDSALKVIRSYPEELSVYALSTHWNLEKLHEQVEDFHPTAVSVMDEEAASTFRERHPELQVLVGLDGLCELAAMECDVVLCGVVGSVGLRPILSAIESGNRIALANKEPMVMAGDLIMGRAKAKGVEVLPVDSEHNAIFQCLEGHTSDDVYKIHLTASGGPFYRQPREILAAVTPEQAANHPTWNMGAKISIDSATLMNKGLEVIEAMWLFDMPLDKIDVIIHRQSIVHSLVEFTDGSILAYLGATDMVMPIQFALTWPTRVKSPMARLDLTTLDAITFAPPDFEEFPCLGYALEAARLGGTAGTVLNAANEVAVEAFRNKEIPFLSIASVVGEVLNQSEICTESTLEGVLDADAEARSLAKHAISTLIMA